VAELHLRYLQGAALASRCGGITWRGEQRFIGGVGWMARTNGDGRFELIELGELG
jgi:hypothetical protein